MASPVDLHYSSAYITTAPDHSEQTATQIKSEYSTSEMLRPQLVRSSSSLSTISSVSSATSEELERRAKTMSPSLSIGGSPIKIADCKHSVLLSYRGIGDDTTEKDEAIEDEHRRRQQRAMVVKGRAFDWSPLPWSYAEVPSDWWLTEVNRKLADFALLADNEQDAAEIVEEETRGRSGAPKEEMISGVYDDENYEYNYEEEDDDEYCMYEEPEEIEQEYDSRGRPILRLLTTFKGVIGLESAGRSGRSAF